MRYPQAGFRVPHGCIHPHVENDRIVESTNEARAAVTGQTVKNIVLIGTVLMIVLVAVAVVTLAARMTLI